MESILTSIKKMLGIAEDYTHFDADIAMHINSVFMTLRQLGVGPSTGFRIEDKNALWSDFIPSDDLTMEAVKTYMYLKVRLVFDPPTSSAAMTAMQEMAKEYEWRLNASAESDVI